MVVENAISSAVCFFSWTGSNGLVYCCQNLVAKIHSIDLLPMNRQGNFSCAVVTWSALVCLLLGRLVGAFDVPNGGQQRQDLQEHWSFVAAVRPAMPAVQSVRWPASPIDVFVVGRLEKEGLQPSVRADELALLRRVTFDLTGLPPVPSQVQRFLADDLPDAYVRYVDRLLGSPRYGERMAVIWLDLARYADTNGYQQDMARTQWNWRDWVIDAYNRNLPFDQFTIEQLAGDLLEEATLEQLIATGFNRNHLITIETGVIDEEYRVEYVMDRVVTTGTVWMGLTFVCARCHDHKYDPLSQRDFYQLFAFFNNVPEKGLNGFEPRLATPNAKQVVQLAALEEQIVVAKQKLKASPTDEQKEWLAGLEQSQKRLSETVPQTLIMRELPQARQTFILNRGLYDQPREMVQPGVPQGLPPLSEGGLTNRLKLARWLVDRGHPLTARVISNRLWQQLFGAGIVFTTEDFGTQGTPPTHPQLLDWLAIELMDRGWNVKQILRQLVTSSTYGQKSQMRSELLQRDPYNRLLARGPRYRLDAEMVRDQALVVSGLLVEQLGGEPVFPYQPQGVWLELNNRKEFTRPYPESKDSGLYRRSLYSFWKRTVPPPSLSALDAPDREYCVTRRSRTNTPLQALVLLHDRQFVEAARHLGLRMLREGGGDVESRLRYGFLLALTRQPSRQELAVTTELLLAQLAEFSNNPAAAQSLLDVGKSPADASLDTIEQAAWTTIARMMLNLNETITKY